MLDFLSFDNMYTSRALTLSCPIFELFFIFLFLFSSGCFCLWKTSRCYLFYKKTKSRGSCRQKTVKKCQNWVFLYKKIKKKYLGSILHCVLSIWLLQIDREKNYARGTSATDRTFDYLISSPIVAATTTTTTDLLAVMASLPLLSSKQAP